MSGSAPDRRRHLSNGRVAHRSLEGQVEADRFIDGTVRQVAVSRAALRSAPDGGREREVVLGEQVLMLEERDGFAFVALSRDGFVGYLEARALAEPTPTTHRICAARSYAKGHPDLKRFEPVQDLSYGMRVQVLDQSGDWAQITLPAPLRPEGAESAYMPVQHLCPLDQAEPDPIAIARRFLGTPYLWGGNSGFGIDCSGLVQAAMLGCGRDCPGDSDQQCAGLGDALPGGAEMRPGDLLFWRGHVALISTPELLLHATAQFMSVVEEPLTPALERIAASEAGPVLAHKRITD